MKQLIENAMNGDRLAEQQLLGQLLVRFRHFAAHKVDAENVDEIAQQACVTILEKYRTEKFTVSFQAWAYGVLKMTIRQHLRDETRQSARQKPLLPDATLPQPDGPHPMLRQYLLECIKWLARSYSKYARIVNLHYQGYQTSEICERLKINREQYYVYLGRGRSMLRDCLSGKGALI